FKLGADKENAGWLNLGRGEIDVSKLKKKPKTKSGKKDEKKKMSELKFHRKLTIYEKNVKFDEIRQKMDQQEQGLVQGLYFILSKEHPGLMRKFEEAVENKDYHALKAIAWTLKPQYTAVFHEHIRDLFEFGKLKASYEIAKPAPPTIGEIKQDLNDRALYLSNFHEEKMMEEMKQKAAYLMMDDAVPTSKIMEELEHQFDVYKNRNIKASAALTTSGEINRGRSYTFKNYDDEIYAYQWSALLDGATCNYCKSMDTSTIGVHDKAFNEYRPGEVHFHCRCIWVAIMKEEFNKPPITGISKMLRPQSQVPPWNFKDIEFPVAGPNTNLPYGVYE
ncbi:MAG: hypothetical protein U9O78_04365, partial [Patescibacteria group bacterium]|nr:hypothetical protein [Patescibacteria group bacterium]